MIRIGQGFDVHPFAENRQLILGGVRISYNQGLQGHSDADVLTHAVMDAILGALGLADIGTLFPDTDSAYRDVNSLGLLEQVWELAHKQGYTLGNLDATLVAQKPKIAPYKDQIRDNLAKVLGSSKERINIKATTTEGLGFIGRLEGIAALAVVCLFKGALCADHGLDRTST